MSAVVFNCSGGAGLGSGSGDSTEGLDKIDMSLDDIIKLNRKEQKTTRLGKGKLLVNGHFAQGRRAGPWTGPPTLRGGGAVRLGALGWKTPLAAGRRWGQGIITGLAARRHTALHKGISPLNRADVTQSRPLLRRSPAPYGRAELRGRPLQQMDMQSTPDRSLRRRPPVPAHQAQRDARQATFLFRRGLKVRAQVQSPATLLPAQGARPWRTSTSGTGILTVSIDNPTARTQPEPPRAWSLYPHVPQPGLVVKEEERKPPKGVALQFDINSVGKQTTMTLNERFRILKERRTAAGRGARGSRFVTVG